MKNNDLIIEKVDDPVLEAKRYVMNARDLLNTKGDLDTETQLYRDRKCVRMAGNSLWNGILVIVEATFHLKTKQRPHPDAIDYKNAIAQRDKKLLRLFVVGYEFMHITMGYDGLPDKEVCASGIRIANDIIDRCGAMIN